MYVVFLFVMFILFLLFILFLYLVGSFEIGFDDFWIVYYFIGCVIVNFFVVV